MKGKKMNLAAQLIALPVALILGLASPALGATTSNWLVYRSEFIAPHGLTQRWTYTVPAGKSATVWMQVAVIRDGPATVPGEVSALIQLVPPSGPNAGIANNVLAAETFSNTVDGQGMLWQTWNAVQLNAGDTINAATRDLSTGGTCGYRLTALVQEADHTLVSSDSAPLPAIGLTLVVAALAVALYPRRGVLA